MARFAETKLFTKYVKDRSNKPCVVIPITFNSQMEIVLNKRHTIGLRMLYAAAMSMSDKEEYSQHTWVIFSKMFKNFASLEALDAVDILKSTYGKDRRMLLLVDELSKAKDDQEAMKEIGIILNEERTVDVLVSSLSPNYIATLITGSQRPVEYVVLPPLVEEKLGRAETKRWADKVLENMAKEKEMKEIPSILRRMVESVYLFASGHPRSIEKLLRSLDKNIEEWKSVIKVPRHSMLWKIYNLADIAEGKIKSSAPEISDSVTVPFILEEVLSCKTYATAELTPMLREAVEKGLIYLGRDPQRRSQYSPYIRLGTLFDYLSDTTTPLPPNSKATELVLRVLGDLKPPVPKKSSLSVLFERFIAFNILVRGEDRFGVEDLNMMDTYNSVWTFRRCEKAEDLSVANMNEVILPDLNDQPGFDLRACCDISSRLNTNDPKQADYIYIQIKSGRSKKNKKRAVVVAKAVLNIIQAHMKLMKSWEVVAEGLGDKKKKQKKSEEKQEKLSLSNLHVIFYDWGCRERSSDPEDGWPTKEALLQAFQSLVDDLQKKKSGEQKTSLTEEEIEATRTFLSETYHSNLHVVGKEKMDKWLLPTLAVIPHLIEEVEEKEEEEEG